MAWKARMTSRSGSSRQRTGLTLIEVLVSVVILSTGSVLILQALAKVAEAQARLDDQANLYLFAISKMAEAELAVETGALPRDQESGSFRVESQTFDWALSVSPAVDDPQVYTIGLDVEVRNPSRPLSQRVETVLRVPPAPVASP